MAGPAANAATMLRAALVYATRLGWSVFPCAGKVPAIRGGRGCLDATRDETTISRWWNDEHPGSNIGIAAGTPSGFWVLDIDGDDGEESLAELVAASAPLPHTVEQLTGGGRHVLFAYAGEAIKNAVRFAPGLDVRTSGGYIVAAPSLHPQTGRVYAWSVDAHPLETPLAPAPAWLLEAVAGRRGGDVHSPAQSQARVPWLSVACGAVPAGQRNATLARVAGHLLRRCDPLFAAQLCRDWNARHCRPPLPDDEVARIVNSIAAAELRRLARERPA